MVIESNYVWLESGAAGADKHEVDPISRIEGHLGVKVAVDASGKIIDANAHGNLWRGFENFLLGRRPNDPITFTQRICGVCPVPHGMTATYAADAVLGYSRGHITFAFDATDVDPTGTPGANTTGYGVPAKAVMIRNLVLMAEFLMSSITHFYHLAAPSYVQGPNMPPWTPYFDNAYYSTFLQSGGAAAPNAAAPELWDSVIISYVKALKFRRLCFEAGALFAGRMPMTSCYVAGGVTNDTSTAGDPLGFAVRCQKFRDIIQQVGEFIFKEYVPIALALGMLYQDFDSNDYVLGSGTVTQKANNEGMGAGLGRFLAWGAFPGADATGTLALPGGVFDKNGDVGNFQVLNKADVYDKFIDPAATGTCVPANLTEDIAHSRYDISDADVAAASYTGTAAYPGDVQRTKPARMNGYSYMKAPRWNGFPCEVGPLARLVVAGIYPIDGTPLATAIPGYALYTDGSGAVDPTSLDGTLAAGIINSGVLTYVAEWILGIGGGLSIMDRLRARALESLVLVQAMVGSLSRTPGSGTLSWGSDGLIDALEALDPDTEESWIEGPVRTTGTFHGWGGTEAPRGALMHQSTITNNKISAYQCIVPTTWNGSPKCTNNRHGAIEKAMLNVTFAADGAVFTSQDGSTTVTTQGGVEVLRVAQSFDPCIACAVH